MRNALAGAILAAAAAALPARAQRVRGALTDKVTREPVPGAVVSLADSGGRMLARSIADADGRFSVMRFDGSRTMRVVRIGFRPRDIVLAPADSVVDLALDPIAPMLAAISSDEKRVCPGATTGGAALDLWEQARAGLLAAVVSRETSPPRIRLRSYRRTMEPVSRELIADTVEYRDLTADRPFMAARPSWAFAYFGYMRESPGGMREYFGPDEAVMLDETFAESHCLHVVEGRGPRADEIGLGFEPIQDAAHDTLVDVAGTLWLERAGLRLRTLEFHYTNLEYAARSAGGEMKFALMPNGVSMIEHWVIRTPILAIDPEFPFGSRREVLRRDRHNVRTLGYRESGGQVAAAAWPDGKRWFSALPHISGVVATLDKEPVAGAVVWIRDSHDTVRTGVDGRFDFPPMAPGIHVVMASDSVLASEGIARVVPVRAMLFNDMAPSLKLDFYPREDALRTVCPRNSYKPGTGVLLARVFDSRGEPASNATIEVEASELVVAGDTLATQLRRGEAGDDGRFVVCGAAPERTLIVRALKNDESAGIAVKRWGGEIASVAIRLRPRIKP